MMGDGINFTTMGYGANGIFWILLIVLIVWLYSVFTNRNNTTEHSSKNTGTHHSPEEILKQRYAEGKIDLDEFNKRMAHLHRNIQH